MRDMRSVAQAFKNGNCRAARTSSRMAKSALQQSSWTDGRKRAGTDRQSPPSRHGGIATRGRGRQVIPRTTPPPLQCVAACARVGHSPPWACHHRHTRTRGAAAGTRAALPAALAASRRSPPPPRGHLHRRLSASRRLSGLSPSLPLPQPTRGVVVKMRIAHSVNSWFPPTHNGLPGGKRAVVRSLVG